MARGRVTEFDEHRGTGTVTAGDGTLLFFHCTCFTGGPRVVAVGTPVSFAVVPGRRGRWEATELQPLEPPPEG